MLNDIVLPAEVFKRLKPLLGTKKFHQKIAIYVNGDRKITHGISDDFLLGEVRFDFAFKFGRAIFIDGIYIFRGYLSEEKCITIEKELQAAEIKSREVKQIKVV